MLLKIIPFVTYWPSPEPSIKKQVNPDEEIGILPWPVDVVEFDAHAHAHMKHVDVKQWYIQVPYTTWVSSRQRVWVAVEVRVWVSWSVQFQSQLGTRCQRENQLADRRLAAPSDPRLSRPGRMRKKCCYGQRRTLGQYVTVCCRRQLTSHWLEASILSQPFRE